MRNFMSFFKNICNIVIAHSSDFHMSYKKIPYDIGIFPFVLLCKDNFFLQIINLHEYIVSATFVKNNHCQHCKAYMA